MARQRKSGSLVWGIILIAFGVLFLLDQFNIDIWDAVWRFWPVILIIWGADKLYHGLKDRNAEAPAPDKTHEV
jgi:LiaF transmembrane domain